MVRVAGFDSRRCGGLVARGHNSPPDCCSVPLVLQIPQIKKPTNTKVLPDFLVGVAGFEPTASWSRTKRATNCATPRNIKLCGII